MLKKPFKLTASVAAAVLLAACSGSSFDNDLKQKESLYNTTGNHIALISLYRSSLQQKENDEIRYKLSQSYYQSGDGESALLYLKPLLSKTDKVAKDAKMLQIKALIQTGKYQEAINFATKQLQADPKNGEIYNLRGIAFAQAGDLTNARKDINTARAYFISDTVAINNLATLHILSEQYGQAADLLMPHYMNDVKEPKLVYNLIFALVKSGRIGEAKSIIAKENPNGGNADEVVRSLAAIRKAGFMKKM